MTNEYYGVASTPTEDFLAHYGIKGMKWGVRKAIQRGSDRALSRQYNKAQKKLAKLEKLANNGKKYAKRAAGYGAGAALAGTIAGMGASKFAGAAVKGAGHVATGAGNVTQKLGSAMMKSRNAKIRNLGYSAIMAGKDMKIAGIPLKGSTSARVANEVDKWGKTTHNININKTLGIDNNSNLGRKLGTARLSNNTLVRAGAGAVGAGLGIAAARNAYRAATAKKHAQQAKEFKAEMNKTFAGTKYASGSQKKKRRK